MKDIRVKGRVGGSIILIPLLLLSLLFISACQKASPDDPRYCTTADDCVPASCCHPSSSVNKEHMPNCTAILCTMECRPNTLDCGQGRIDCVNNRCEVLINEQE